MTSSGGRGIRTTGPWSGRRFQSPHPGRSGALTYADPASGLAFAYVTNYVIVGSPDPRVTNLVAALG